MSSPLTMLKKTKRSPLQGTPSEPRCRQNVAFRKDPSSGSNSSLSDASEGQSDDAQSPLQCTDAASTSNPSGGEPWSRPPSITVVHIPSPSADARQSDFNLMSAMMQQVILLEKRVWSQEEELLQKDRKIALLEGKLAEWEQSDAAREETNKQDLEDKCQQLQDQVSEMESVLSEFGLIWLGEPRDSEVKDFSMDFDLVLERVKELNVLAGEEQTFIRPTSTGAQLGRVDPVPLRLYSNGIIMCDGPFRSFQEPSAQWCMLDIMEGYFPSELQEQFPDGVPFEVYDHRDEEFSLDQLWLRFPGDGQTILGERFESTKPACCHLLGRKPKRSRSLLPRVMIRAGELFEIRDSVTANLLGVSGACSDSPILVETKALQSMKERLQTSTCEPTCPPLGEVTLKVRSEDGENTYLLKMSISETVADIRRYLDQHRGDGAQKYDIISANPHRCYDDSWTLQSSGLTCNCTLVLRKRTPPAGPKQKRRVQGGFM
ncbi:UBX domain-containing protein 11 [Neosynchiropus ocellatus]